MWLPIPCKILVEDTSKELEHDVDTYSRLCCRASGSENMMKGIALVPMLILEVIACGHDCFCD